jgi:alkanesulfonate monooxygenase SsuD/methylene tetrahydromethanopterin reductase-like flavin-dependent oxidoreductase (luciferase family)
MDQSGERPIHPWVAEGQRRVRFGVGTVGARRADAGFLAWARRVEALGFDSYWVQDHPLSGPDCWTSLTALALATERLRLGTLVCCGYYRSPTLLVRQAADVDRLSGGRLVLGFGHGDAEDEFRQMGLTFPPVPERQALLEETLRVVRGLWSGEPFTLEGTHVRVRKARLAAGPIQRPHVPLPIAGGGERVTLRQVARYGDVSNFGEDAHAGGVRTPDDVRRRLETLRGHCAAGGRTRRS